MRTTLTLDPDVERLLSDEVHRTRRPFKQVVNDALRRGLGPGLADERQDPYRVKVHHARLRPGIDPTAMNRLADELEDESVLQKGTRSKARK
ncbi:MAG TPA: antitoxin [Polyangia bacterium]|nr:antitoxin [Polyangia bacterium]